MAGRQVIIPLENIRVPLAEFGQVFNLAGCRWIDGGRTNRYIAGVFYACQWVAEVTDVAPIGRESLRADPTTIRLEMDRAVDIVYDIRQSEVSEEWALGVMKTLGWVLNVFAQPPIKIYARR